MRQRERERERERQRPRQREKQAPCRASNVGLDPGSPGSRPGLKADAKLLSHPGIPRFHIFYNNSKTVTHFLLFTIKAQNPILSGVFQCNSHSI